MLNSCQGKTKVLGLRQCFTFLEKKMWKGWCWSWNSSTLATWCKELTHWTRPWCWERLKAGGEGDDRGWNGWMASLTQWTWVWENSGSWWWTGRPGVLQSMGVTKSRTRLSNWTELNWTETRPNKKQGGEASPTEGSIVLRFNFQWKVSPRPESTLLFQKGWSVALKKQMAPSN